MIRGGRSRKEGIDATTPPQPGRFQEALLGVWRFAHSAEVPKRLDLQRATRDSAAQATLASEAFAAPAPAIPRPDNSHAILAAESFMAQLPVTPRCDDASFILAAEAFGG